MLYSLLALLTLPLATSAAPKTLVVLGDSLTEGYGVAKESAFPALLEKKLRAAGKDWKVVNSGVSGSTSASATGRVEWILKAKAGAPDALLLALGANDGLRGLPVKEMEENLRKAIRAAKTKGVKVFLAGILMPPNFGKEYATDFAAAFPRLAREEKVDLLPFLLEKVGGVTKLNLADGIHPNEEGYKIVAETVFQFLKGRL